jgi:hypothetical protein
MIKVHFLLFIISFFNFEIFPQNHTTHLEKNKWNGRNLQSLVGNDLNRINAEIFANINSGSLKILDFYKLRQEAGVEIAFDSNWVFTSVGNPYNIRDSSDFVIFAAKNNPKTSLEGFFFLIDSENDKYEVVQNQLKYLDTIQYQYVRNFLGWIEISHLKKVLDTLDYALFNAYRLQLNAGSKKTNSRTDWMYVCNKNKKAILFGMDGVNIIVDHNYARLSQIFHLLNENKINYTDYSAYFFRDHKQTKSYDSIAKDIYFEKDVVVVNPENPMDPYDVIYEVTKSHPTNIALTFIKVYDSGSDYSIVGYAKSERIISTFYDLRVEKQEVTLTWNEVHFSYKSIKKFFKPYDILVLEKLFQQIST